MKQAATLIDPEEDDDDTSLLPEGLQPELFSISLTAAYEDGRDEMNLSEFPITAIGNRVDRTTKTLIYEDKTRDNRSGDIVNRKLTITAADAYGLPTAVDDELLLGLVQLSRIQGFTSQEVYFTPYQLLQILGWPDHEAYYRRLKDGLRRWAGVLMSYENAWRDKGTGEWVDATFHFIDNVEFYRRDGKSALARDGLSYFKWNDVIFKSFRAGNLKQLDFSLYRVLQSGLAKRMFRFLDKRFYHQHRLSFDLHVFAFEKVGIARAAIDAAQIKRRLMPGIKELEKAGYIVALAPDQRFTKSGKKWNVHFEKARSAGESALEYIPDILPPRGSTAAEQQSLGLFDSEHTAMEARLVTHGVSRAKAKKLVGEHSAAEIDLQIEVLEYLISQEKAPYNPGGWLTQAIVNGYSPPRDFKTREEREREEREHEELERLKQLRKQRKDAEAAARKQAERARLEEQRRRVVEYLDELSPPQRTALEKAAVKKAGLPVKPGTLLWDSVVANHVLELLDSPAPPSTSRR